jgi:hypothetical protein
MGRKGQLQAADEPVPGRLDGHSRHRVAQVGLMNESCPKAGGPRVLREPAQRQFVGNGEDDQGVRCRVPVRGQIRVRDSEVESRMRRLAGLRPGRKISTGDQIKAAGVLALTVRHYAIIPKTADSCQADPPVLRPQWQPSSGCHCARRVGRNPSFVLGDRDDDLRVRM